MRYKVLTVFALLLMALSVVGTAYAHWYETLYIDGTVKMGTLTIGFTEILGCTDKEEYHKLEKDVGSILCELSEPVTDAHTLKTVYKRLSVTLENSYPCYWGECHFTVDGAGTIPGVFDGLIWVIRPPDWVEVDFSGFPCQVDPCTAYPSWIRIHTKQEAPECTTVNFALEVVYRQWDGMEPLP